MFDGIRKKMDLVILSTRLSHLKKHDIWIKKLELVISDFFLKYEDRMSARLSQFGITTL